MRSPLSFRECRVFYDAPDKHNGTANEWRRARVVEGVREFMFLPAIWLGFAEQGVMKRVGQFIGWNSLIGAAFCVFWSLIVVLDFRVAFMHASILLKLAYFGSLPASFIVFTVANCRILGSFGGGVLAGLLITPITYFIGLVLMVNFKFLLGGTI